MKILFLIFHGFNPASGISKKIHDQVSALKNCGIDTRLCYLQEENGKKLRMIDSTIIADYSTGIMGKILKRVEYNSILKYVIKEKIDFVYMRSDLNANPFIIHLVKNMRKVGVSIAMEIPTYPYDQEEDTTSRKIQKLIDRIYRNKLAKYLNRIVTFSDFNTIFGVPTIRISNGIDFSKIKLKKQVNNIVNELHLIGVAEIHYWHGFDRLLKGLALYYQTKNNYRIFFHLVGDFFGKREQQEIVPLIRKYELQPYVTLHGPKHGKDLDALFEQGDFAIGSLARHRTGIYNIKTLKNREYAARGLGFIYSETDDDFDNMPYILKVPADESPIDIPTLIHFCKNQSISPQEIRDSIQHLSWIKQMRKVYESMMFKPDKNKQ